MFGADVVVAELTGLLDGQLEDALGLWGEGHLPEREGLRESGQSPLDLRLHGLELEPEALKHGRGDPLPVPDQAEQDVLGPHEVVPKTARLLPRQDDDSPRALGEPFEHLGPRFQSRLALSHCHLNLPEV